MSRFFSLFVLTVGAMIVFFATVGYLPLRDFALNGTPTFNPQGHFVLGPLSLGLESALDSSTTSGNMDVATYCVALQRRLTGLALVGLIMLIVGAAGARSTAPEKSAVG